MGQAEVEPCCFPKLSDSMEVSNKTFFSESCIFRAVFSTFSPLEESKQTLETVCATNSVQDTQLRGKRGRKKQPNIQTEHTFKEASEASSSKLMQMESELPKAI